MRRRITWTVRCAAYAESSLRLLRYHGTPQAHAPMHVRCSRCHEEVLGSVNRCWRCGQSFSLPHPDRPLPPERQETPPATAALLAEVLDPEFVAGRSPRAHGTPSAELPASALASSTRGTVGVGLSAPATRRDSAPWSALVLAATSFALLMGLASLALLGRFPAGSLALSLLGIAAGCLALGCGGRRAGSMALLMSCFAAWLSGFALAVALYTATHNVPPWSPAAPRASSVRP